MIDILSDDCMSLTEACRLLPRGRRGAKPHLSTVLRWILDGAPGPHGERVKLAAVRCGAKWVTSRAALQEFAAALTPALPTDGPQSLPRTPTQRERAAARAARELEKIGI